MFNIKNLFSSTKRVWPWVKAHKIWSSVIAVLFIIIAFSLVGGGEASLADKTSEVKTGTVAQEVSVTGRVKGAEAVGIKGIIFENTEQCKSELDKLLSYDH